MVPQDVILAADGSEAPPRRFEYIFLDDGKTIPKRARARSDLMRWSLDLTKDDNTRKLDMGTLDLASLHWKLDNRRIYSGLQGHLLSGTITFDIPSELRRSEDVGAMRFAFNKPYQGTLGIWRSTCDTVSILVRYVPDAIRLLEVEVSAIDYLDHAEDYVTHRIKIMKPICERAVVAEFDMCLVLRSIKDFCLQVRRRGKVLRHHPYEVFIGGVYLDKTSATDILDAVPSLPHAAPRRMGLVRLDKPVALAAAQSPRPHKRLRSVAAASSALWTAASTREDVRRHDDVDSSSDSSHLSSCPSSEEDHATVAELLPSSSMFLKQELLRTSILSHVVLHKFCRGFCPCEDPRRDVTLVD